MKKTLICALLSMVMLSGCSFLGKSEGIIKVNDNVITKAEFDKALDKEIDNSAFRSFGGAKNFLKTKENIMYTIFRDKVTHELIVKTLIEEEIAKRGIEISEEDVKAEMKSIIDKVGSKEELNNILKQRGVTNDEFTDDLKTQIKIKKLINSIKKVTISDAEAEKYYKSNIDKFKHEEQVRASHILISADTLEIIKTLKAKNKNITPEEMDKKLEQIRAEKKALAEDVLAEVKANPDKFEAIAAKRSEDKVSGERGGELGFFSRGDMVEEFSKAAFSMKPNTISDSLVKTNYGYHIIKVTDRVEAGVKPFVKVKGDVKFYLETQEQIKVLKNLTDGLMKNAKIEYLDKDYKPAEDITKKVAKEENKNK